MTRPALASRVYTTDDLAAILQAIALTAALSSDGQSPHAAAYRRGFSAALAAMAVATHIDLQVTGHETCRLRIELDHE